MHNVLKLKKGWEFDVVFRTGIRVNGELVRLLYLQSDPLEIKFGLAVGKRLGKSHVRNRGRRILREAFRQLCESAEIKPGLKIVLSLKAKGLDAKTQDIFNELENLFRRRKLLCSPVSQ